MKLLQGYLLLKDWKNKEAVTDSGLLVPEEIDQPENEATVAVVPEGYDKFTPGDRVLIKKYLFEELDHGGTKYLVGKEDGIIAIL